MGEQTTARAPLRLATLEYLDERASVSGFDVRLRTGACLPTTVNRHPTSRGGLRGDRRSERLSSTAASYGGPRVPYRKSWVLRIGPALRVTTRDACC
jgi:hypothetical protein